MARKLTDMQFDEVSLVDRAANQFADIVIAKNDATDYDEMESLLAEFSDRFAKAADDDDDDDYEEDEDDEEEGEEEETSKAFPPPKDQQPMPQQPAQPAVAAAPAAPTAQMPPVPAVPTAAPVPGMAPGAPMAAPPAAPAPGTPPPQLPQVQLPPEVVQYIKALEARISALTNQQGNLSPMAQSQQPQPSPEGEGVRKMGQEDESVFAALAKALASDDTDPQIASDISKAMDLVSKAQARADEAERIAKEERDYRLEQEYISKAANLALPVSPQELGPVLKRMDDLMDHKDAEIITKALLAGSEAIQTVFEEAGTTYGAAYETLSKVDQVANELVAKSGHQMTREQATAAIYEMDPSLYSEYLSDKNGGR